MTSSDMNESAVILSSTIIDNPPRGLHKKRSSSTMSPPHSTSWVPNDSYTHTHNYERPLKAIRQLSPSETITADNQPWTNVEQEALYIAVKRYRLYGQWAEVKDRMELNRSTPEIELEYMRLYGELPDSEDEDWLGSEGDYRVVPTHAQMHGQTTPALTSTSSSTLSARSSRETFNIHPTRPSQPTMTEQTHRQPYRKHVAQRSPIDDYHGHENDESRMDTELPSPPSGKSSVVISTGRSRSDAIIAADAKPTRTVRVWTVEQSEQLKSLIEDCFPGGYRINWVWVASQMGNTFTRKQCKNKWEIMRRRAGTEEEIALLKKGHEEFGPSWNKIQEKYLPERSQGGISIMWSLLLAREAEQQQHFEKKQTIPRREDAPDSDSMKPAPRSPGHTRRIMNDGVRSGASSRTKISEGPPTKKHRDVPYQPRVLAQSTGDEQEIPHRLLSDKEARDRQRSTSRENSLSPTWSKETVVASLDTPAYLAAQDLNSLPYKRTSVSSTESISIASAANQENLSDLHHHQQKHTPEPSSEPWMERNRPMTWTEPLTRRLEDIIHQHFPNHQKVNWIKVSSLMGTNPVVTKEQCKRRWYLMSQYEHLRSRQSESPFTVFESPSNTMAMDVDPSEDVSSPEYRRNSHAESLSLGFNSSHSAEAYGSSLHHQKRPAEYVQWTDEEVDLLKQGVKKFGRSWGAIQKHYLKDRTVSSMASKWEYLRLKMRSTTNPDIDETSPTAHLEQLPGDNSTDYEMEDEERVREDAYDNQSSDKH